MKIYYSIYVSFVLTLLLTSCSLFGGGGNTDHSVPGGEVVWRHENNRDNLTSLQPLVDNQRVYYLQDGYLKCSTLKKGKLIWSKKVLGTGDFSRMMLSAEKDIYIDLGLEIRSYAKKDGTLIWKRKVSDQPKEYSGIGFPIMSQDQSSLYVGREGYVVQLRKSNGQITRRYPLDRLVPEGITQGSTEPIISPFGDDILYVPGIYFDRTKPTAKASTGNIFAYKASTGSLLWEHKIKVTVPDRSTPAPNDSLTGSPFVYDISVTEDKVIVLAGFYIIALNRMTGKPVWKTYFSDGGFDVGLAVKGEGVYAASVGTFATRVDLNTGRILWKRDIQFSNTSIPTVQNGRLYLNNSGGGAIWVLDIKNGSVMYHKRPPNFKNNRNDTYLSSLGVGSGYMVDIGGKAVYCLKVP